MQGDYQDAYANNGDPSTQSPPPGYHWDAAQGTWVPDGGANVPAPGNDANAISGYYSQFLGRAPDDSGLASWQGDLANGSLTLGGVQNAIANSPEADAYNKAHKLGNYAQLPGNPAPATGGSVGGALAPYGAAPPAFPNIPAFTPPPAYVPGQFKAPTIQEALNDPGYQFRTQQGESALMRTQAARGLGNDSGSLKALIDYGQNAGEQGYGNVYARDFNTWQANENANANAYKTNYGTQYVDPYQINRQTQYLDPWTAAYNT